MSVLETLDVGQANELKLAFRKHGWSNEEVKRLSEGDALARVHSFLFPAKEVSDPVIVALRETGDLTLTIPALPRLTLEALQSRWDWIKSIEKDDSPLEPVKLALSTVLKKGEGKISGPECQLRLASNQSVLLGLSQALWLEEHQAEFPELMVLLEKIYIDFPATIVVACVGYRLFPCLLGGSKHFRLFWFWLDGAFGPGGRVASRK